MVPLRCTMLRGRRSDGEYIASASRRLREKVRILRAASVGKYGLANLGSIDYECKVIAPLNFKP